MSKAPTLNDLLLNGDKALESLNDAPRKAKGLPLNLPLITLIAVRDENEVANFIQELAEYDSSRIYIEDLLTPVYDMVEAMLNHHGLTSMRDSEQDFAAVHPLLNGNSPFDVAHSLKDHLQNTLGSDIFTHLLVNKIKELSHFTSYRFIIRDVWGETGTIVPLLKEFPADVALIATSQILIPGGEPAWAPRFIPLPALTLENLKREIGTV